MPHYFLDFPIPHLLEFVSRWYALVKEFQTSPNKNDTNALKFLIDKCNFREPVEKEVFRPFT